MHLLYLQIFLYNQQCNMTFLSVHLIMLKLTVDLAVICHSALRNMTQCNVFSCVNKHNQPVFTNVFNFQRLFRKYCFYTINVIRLTKSKFSLYFCHCGFLYLLKY